MGTDIYSSQTGRAISTYDLLTEMQDAHGLARRETHDSIAAFLAQIIDIDGHDKVVLSQRPVRPELLVHNEQDVDVDYWLEISDAAADSIREAFAAAYPA